MTEPYVQEYDLGEFKLTSVVLDEGDFMSFCDEIGESGIFELSSMERSSEELIQSIKENKHLPMMGRGSKTEVFFDRWGVKTDRMAVIVRGHGPQLAQKLFE